MLLHKLFVPGISGWAEAVAGGGEVDQDLLFSSCDYFCDPVDSGVLLHQQVGRISDLFR
jgi:hypothetical protein